MSALDARTGATLLEFPHEIDMVEATEDTPAYVRSLSPAITIEMTYTDEEVARLDTRNLFLYTRPAPGYGGTACPPQRIPKDKLWLGHVERLGDFVLMARNRLTKLLYLCWASLPLQHRALSLIPMMMLVTQPGRAQVMFLSCPSTTSLPARLLKCLRWNVAPTCLLPATTVSNSSIVRCATIRR